ncbi:hypothetical protein FACS189421_02990 [Bacteroidia bacterium]|nr:hypothetical protein FACS189421_02990 [Bacteroidia bacterium]
MIWIVDHLWLVLAVVAVVVGLVLFLLGGVIAPNSGKTFSTGSHLVKKLIEAVGIVLLILGIWRIATPYYLTDVNPAILQEMAQGIQAQQQAEASKGVKSYVRGHLDEMMRNAPVMGNVDAAKTVIVFTDTSCPFCQRVHGELNRVMADHSDVRVVVKAMSIHGPLSDFPAKAIMAAKIQDNAKAVAFFDAIMTGGKYWPDDMTDGSKVEAAVKKNILAIAGQVGLDVTRLEQDVNSPTVSEEMSQVNSLAQRFQIGGTPFLIIGDQAFPGAIPYDQIVQALK